MKVISIHTSTKYEISELVVADQTMTNTERVTTTQILVNDILLINEVLSNWHWPDAGQEQGLYGKSMPIIEIRIFLKSVRNSTLEDWWQTAAHE